MNTPGIPGVFEKHLKDLWGRHIGSLVGTLGSHGAAMGTPPIGSPWDPLGRLRGPWAQGPRPGPGPGVPWGDLVQVYHTAAVVYTCAAVPSAAAVYTCAAVYSAAAVYICAAINTAAGEHP